MRNIPVGWVLVGIIVVLAVVVGLLALEIQELKRIEHTIAEAATPITAEPTTEPSAIQTPNPHAEAIGKIETDAGMPLSRIAKLIIRDEGNRNRPYPDGGGVPTIGVGRNLRGNGLSVAELHAIVHEIDYPFLLTHTHIQNGRVRIPTLDLANQIFAKPLTKDDIQLLLTDDLNNVRKETVSVFGQDVWDGIAEARKEAILDTVFNLGLGHFKAFVNFIGAVKAGDWQKAAAELLLSDAAHENILRYHRNAAVIRSGDAKYFEL